jgi:2'-5' RNA ligase
MTRLVVVLPLEPLETGATFTFRDWPLHLTIVPVFEASVIESVERITRIDTAPLTVIAGNDEGFGASGTMAVTVIEPSVELTALHIAASAALAARFENPEYTGTGYRPHVTIKKHGRVHPGDSLTLAQLALVDLTPGRDREVVAIRPLRA